ncbi:hypothetical protein AURDEDRAFT_159708 [Auricularia subglabra TFB-10046 SS5]|nr:hypothetical protein AURDEDRAFT_159708 [Auricularia subglabra TFB-10046 SS5]
MPLLEKTDLPEPDAAPAASSRKRAYADVSPAASRSASPAAKRTKSDLPHFYIELPEPTIDYIRLQFKLERFPGVVRVALVPLNYTFAHLHRFILFLFGWGGFHAHEAQVCTEIVPYAYSNSAKRGEIKQVGRVEWTCRDRNPRSRDDLDDHRYRKDNEVRLDEVWNEDLARSAGEGACGHDEIGIRYRYDLSSPWDVHILLHGKTPFATLRLPSNLPSMVIAKGAAPIEDDDKPEWEMEDNRHKPVDGAIMLHASFGKWLKGEIISYAGRKKQRVWTPEEEAQRQSELVAKFERKRAEVEARREEDDEEDDPYGLNDEEVVFYEDYSDYSDDF